MSFDYYLLLHGDEPERPVGLLAVNNDDHARRLDTMLYDHLATAWTSDPDAVTQLMFGQDYLERRRPVSRAEAEEAAAALGIPMPSEEEFMRISDEAERRRARRRGVSRR